MVHFRDFLDGPVVKTPCSHAGSMGLIRGRGTKILNATLCSHKEKRYILVIVKLKNTELF